GDVWRNPYRSVRSQVYFLVVHSLCTLVHGVKERRPHFIERPYTAFGEAEQSTDDAVICAPPHTRRPEFLRFFFCPRQHAIHTARSEEHTSELQSRENLV